MEKWKKILKNILLHAYFKPKFECFVVVFVNKFESKQSKYSHVIKINIFYIFFLLSFH